MVEATSVTAKGRITPEDSGLWLDSQMEPLKKIVEFAHSQGQNIGIQLSHAGRKASTVAPWLSKGAVATKEVNGWPDDCYAPSAVPYSEHLPFPKEMTIDDIENVKEAFVASVKRAVACGFDVIGTYISGFLIFIWEQIWAILHVSGSLSFRHCPLGQFLSHFSGSFPKTERR